MKKKNFKKKKDESNLNFFKTLLSSLIIIFIFSVLPSINNLIKNSFSSNDVVLNSSKQSFNEILDKKNKKTQDLIKKNASEDDIEKYKEKVKQLKADWGW